jgi:nucleotide-binding universal stress UspA family protein
MIFERIVCGVDGSPGSAEAVRQADLLMAQGGHLLLVGAADVAVAVHAGFQAPAVADMIETEARTALLSAEKSVAYGHPVHPRLVKGPPIGCLMSAAREEDATLVAVGTHGSGRVTGIVLGSVATAMLHEAPCSIFLARSAATRWFPRSIVVGHDGSREARAAAQVGEELAARFGSHVSVLAATGGKVLGLDGVRDVRDLEFDERKPVDALVGASKGSDLVIVGSRGLHGLESLGSVSERVAHQATCSVLVVREGSV